MAKVKNQNQLSPSNNCSSIFPLKMLTSLIHPKILIYWFIIVLLCVVSLRRFGSHKKNSHLDGIPSRVELEELDGLPQNDTFLIDYLRQFHLYPPSSMEYRYRDLQGHRFISVEETKEITKIIQGYLKNMRDGIFVEAGAHNGADELSNTLVLERDYDWTGLLIEGSPLVFPKLMAAHRLSWKSDLPLSKHPHTQLSIFEQGENGESGKVIGKSKEDSVNQLMNGAGHLAAFEVMTVPLYSLVAACKFEVIDYLSLDVGETALEILMNFPFDKVLIRTMVVKLVKVDEDKIEKLIYFLDSKDFRKHADDPTETDLIFIHNSVFDD